jgi:hypothetical protein
MGSVDRNNKIKAKAYIRSTVDKDAYENSTSCFENSSKSEVTDKRDSD